MGDEDAEFDGLHDADADALGFDGVAGFGDFAEVFGNPAGKAVGGVGFEGEGEFAVEFFEGDGGVDEPGVGGDGLEDGAGAGGGGGGAAGGGAGGRGGGGGGGGGRVV